jgi:hypothetical protein
MYSEWDRQASGTDKRVGQTSEWDTFSSTYIIITRSIGSPQLAMPGLNQESNIILALEALKETQN